MLNLFVYVFCRLNTEYLDHIQKYTPIFSIIIKILGLNFGI